MGTPFQPLRDYRAWHDEYDDPSSPLAARLRIVQRRLDELIAAAPPGPVRILSMCAGQGRDVLGVLPEHPRRGDASAALVELDHTNVLRAREAVIATDLTAVEVIEGDAALSDTYAAMVPADIVLACGIFGNVSDADVEKTARTVSMLCRPGAAIIWTRHRNEPDLTGQIRRWLAEAGFDELTFDTLETATRAGIGTARLVTAPAGLIMGHRFFTFIR